MEQSILTLAQKKVLELLGNHTILAPRFYLSGGTALAEFYLKHGSLMKPLAHQQLIQVEITTPVPSPTAPRGQRGRLGEL